jgi:hypothetical protein
VIKPTVLHGDETWAVTQQNKSFPKTWEQEKKYFLLRCGPTRVMVCSFFSFLDATKSVELLWTSNQLVTEIFT